MASSGAPTGNEQLPPSGMPQSEGERAILAEAAKLANKKDTSLKEFLSKMDDYAPIVSPPDLIPIPLPLPSPT